ncbi:MAG: TRAP transporter large permease subunit, partial [Pseudomonadota bacterium]
CFAVILGYYGTKYAWASFKIREISPSYWGPIIWPIKMIVPIGAFFLILQYLKDLIVQIHDVATNPREKKQGLFNNPLVIGLVFAGLVAISLWLFYYQPVVAFTLMMVTLLLFGVHIFAALGLVGACGLFIVFGGEPTLITIPKVAYASMDSFALVCIPLFVFCGEFLFKADAGKQLYDMASKWLGDLPGGLAVATVVACAVFAAISASSVATALTIGLVALPALRAYNYSKPLSYGTLAAGGTLGIMIPPSGPMIVYSAVTEESLGKLFIAGVIPGIMISVLFILYIMIYQHYYTKKEEIQKAPSTTWKEKFKSIYDSKAALMTPVIIVGGIYLGMFTPMEAAAVAVVYSLLIIIVRRKVTWRTSSKLMREAMPSSITLLAIIMGALIMGHFMTMLDLPNMVIKAVNEAGLSRWGVMLMLMFSFLVMGMFLEVISIMMITLPIVYPLIISLGFDGIWFAVIMVLNMELALLTPPVGLNLFVIQSIEETNLSVILRGVWPFLIIIAIGIVILALFPALATWLPNLMIN